MSYRDWPWQVYPDRTGQVYATLANPKLCLHTTETTGYPNYSWPPHITFDPKANTGRQHIPGQLGAYALRSPGGGRSPNYEGGPVFQIEIISYAKDTPNQPDWWYENLAVLVEEVCEYLSIPSIFLEFFGSESYGADAPTRLTWDEFKGYSGVLGHQHVPSNSHWDPGKLDVARLEGMMMPTPEQVAAAVWAYQARSGEANGQPIDMRFQVDRIYRNVDELVIAYRAGKLDELTDTELQEVANAVNDELERRLRD